MALRHTSGRPLKKGRLVSLETRQTVSCVGNIVAMDEVAADQRGVTGRRFPRRGPRARLARYWVALWDSRGFRGSKGGSTQP